jgi:hypothetical protein
MTTDEMLAAVRSWQETQYRGRPASRVRVDFVDGGAHFQSPMPYGMAAPQAAPQLVFIPNALQRRVLAALEG